MPTAGSTRRNSVYDRSLTAGRGKGAVRSRAMKTRVKGGWELTKKSWGALKSNKALMAIPVIGALVAVIPAIILTFPGLFLLADNQTAPGIALVVIGIYLSTVAINYYAVVLAGAANAVFNDEPGPKKVGHQIARSRFKAICGWALLSATLGAIFSLLESQNTIGAIVSALVGTAWALVTFLAIPIIALEGTGPFATVKRSTQLFKERWAGQITGQVTIGAIVALVVSLPSILVMALGIYILASTSVSAEEAIGVVLIIVGVIGLIFGSIFAAAIRGIFGIALYRFAAQGIAVGPFTSEELERSVATRG